jgi:hypothetical protein
MHFYLHQTVKATVNQCYLCQSIVEKNYYSVISEPSGVHLTSLLHIIIFKVKFNCKNCKHYLNKHSQENKSWIVLGHK